MKRKLHAEINIGWLYPEYMSTYGDKGNIMVLERRLAWRSMRARIVPVDEKTSERAIGGLDLLIGGGAQDRQQRLVINDMRDRKKEALRILFESGTPGLFVCGSPQLLGRYYVTGDDDRIEGLDFFPMETRHPGKASARLIGTLVFRIRHPAFGGHGVRDTAVGFENHGGRTYLDDPAQALGTVMTGSGNNGKDGTEGAYANNWLATYSHGPFLAKNPHVADYLLHIAVSRKYGKKTSLATLDDRQEWEAHDVILGKKRG